MCHKSLRQEKFQHSQSKTHSNKLVSIRLRSHKMICLLSKDITPCICIITWNLAHRQSSDFREGVCSKQHIDMFQIDHPKQNTSGGIITWAECGSQIWVNSLQHLKYSLMLNIWGVIRKSFAIVCGTTTHPSPKHSVVVPYNFFRRHQMFQTRREYTSVWGNLQSRKTHSEVIDWVIMYRLYWTVFALCGAPFVWLMHHYIICITPNPDYACPDCIIIGHAHYFPACLPFPLKADHRSFYHSLWVPSNSMWIFFL